MTAVEAAGAVGTVAAEIDESHLVRSAVGLLATFNRAGVLLPADVHTAARIGAICQEADDRVLLAVALTVRALRVGSVCVDLTTVAQTAFDDSEHQLDTSTLPWPDPEAWLAAVRASPAVAVGADAPAGRPLRLAFGRLYLERYWGQEETVRTELTRRAAATPPDVDTERLSAGLARLFDGSDLPAGEPDRQRLAAAVAALGRVTVLAGGPGTGKTTTVARLLALLLDQPRPGDRPLRVALAAPTGKAAARLEEAVRGAAAALDPDALDDADRAVLSGLQASTLHRLLGWRPDSRSRFRHDAQHHLPHDVVVVDEMSMVSLTLMARLLEAVRPDARLVLVGDPDQLSSVEAGAVLADITGAPGDTDTRLVDGLSALGIETPDPVRHGVVALTHTWRFGGVIGELAAAIRASDPDAVMAVLRRGDPALSFVETVGEDGSGSATIDPGAVPELRRAVVSAGRRVLDAARAGEAGEAIRGLEEHRLLCAHRRGPFGMTRWSREAERWLAEDLPGYGAGTTDPAVATGSTGASGRTTAPAMTEWYLGRPLLVTDNDYDLNLYNGDTGVVVRTPSGVRAAFARGADPVLVAPVRLDSVQTMHAMTVHRAQGSQFGTVSFVVPPPDSPLLTRELLYTAVTRARDAVRVIGSEAAIRRSVLRPANRASGLRDRLA
ncbi:exodeoxyribonuclease V subunit alpha [Microlunatus kandeliicorticis]|uniref:exodeoxyribonuclease V subunit alpha n=1 Tax=Microlunatus kandeliicorticis TaxID=1759536 RepID=UPI002E290735|nr:exodeoxyribonuclease V subunit alpha [Microlunatus kandeliicorticis]